MFTTFVEKTGSSERRSGGTLVSFVLHVVVIIAAVQGTLSAKSRIDKYKDQKVEFVQVKKEEPPKEVEKPPELIAPPPPKGFQILTAPIKIPDLIPEIDLSKSMTREEDFSGKGAVGGTSKGVTGGVARPLNSDQVLFDFQVEKPAAAAPNNQPPTYPNSLRSANIEGKVNAKFVVDTTGRADMRTFEIITSDHELFTNAVRFSLPQMRFFPAEVGGRKVKQLVQMPFVFTLTK